MLLILVYWFIIFLFASLSGVASQHFFGLTKTNTAFTLLFGLIFQTVLVSLFAFFYRINFEFFCLNLVLQIVLFVKFRTDFLFLFKNLLLHFSKLKKLLFFGLVLLIALKSSQLPSIFDNESYYIQTIKWLNEYGFVKGVANVHPFLGQFSFWHVLQSGFSFSFLPINFNDINGFILVVGIYYFIEKKQFSSENWSFFSVIFLVFYFQFLDAPSPDLPILVFSSIVFKEFIEHSKEKKSILLFIIFMIFLKLTIAPFLILAFVYLLRNKKTIPFFTITSILFGIIWIVKNAIITGYPLFPLSFFETDFDWKMGKYVLTKLAQVTIDAGYTENLIATENLSLIEKLKLWFHLDGINALFNKGILILFLIIPLTRFFKRNQHFKILYFILIIHFIFLIVTSPQYRFFLPSFILFFTIVIYEISTHLKFDTKRFTLTISLLLVGLSLFMNIKKASDKNPFNFSQILIPDPITKYNSISFEQKRIDDFIFYEAKFSNIYETGNGNLPCVNAKVFQYYNYLPQQRTTDVKDGFTSKELKHE